MNKIGFMQGRLSPIVDNKIQAFPFGNWEQEFSIAKELGIEDNYIDFTNFKRPSAKNLILPRPLPSQDLKSQYYLRGFKAIDKEIQLLKERSQQDKDLMASGYLKIKEELLLVENDNRPNELRNATYIILNDDINSWINFNLEFAKIKKLNYTNLFISISIIIGLIIGTLGVLLPNTIKRLRKTQ